MPITNPTKAIAQINRLLSAFPATGSADPEQTLMRYIEVVGSMEFCDLEDAVSRFIGGTVEGQALRFAPTPAELADAVRKIEDRRWRYQRVLSQAVKQIEARSSVKDGDEVSRMDLVQEALKRSELFSVEPIDPVRKVEAEETRKAYMDKHDRRFIDPTEAAMRERLGYSVGDKDGTEDAA